MKNLNLSDFEKQPRGPYAFDFWIAKEPLSTPIGDFTVELQMGVGDTDPPDDEMLRRANALVALLPTDFRKIQDRVFEHYQMSDDPDRLEEMGIPTDCDRDSILAYLEARSLVVSRSVSDEGVDYTSLVHSIPAWDEEHAIFLAYQEGDWKFHEW